MDCAQEDSRNDDENKKTANLVEVAIGRGVTSVTHAIVQKDAAADPTRFAPARKRGIGRLGRLSSITSLESPKSYDPSEYQFILLAVKYHSESLQKAIEAETPILEEIGLEMWEMKTQFKKQTNISRVVEKAASRMDKLLRTPLRPTNTINERRRSPTVSPE